MRRGSVSLVAIKYRGDGIDCHPHRGGGSPPRWGWQKEACMLKKEVTRREFLRTGFLGILAILALPLSRIFSIKDNVSHKDAKYYKELAG